MIKEEKWNQFGFERDLADISGITFHNTNSDKKAVDIFNYLNEESKDSECFHFIVDNNEVIQCMPLNYGVYSTEGGNNFGNKFTIAVNICSSLNEETYLEAESKAIELVKGLLSEFGLSRQDIYYHKDFNQTIHCPNDILNRYKNKKEFLDNYFNEEE